MDTQSCLETGLTGETPFNLAVLSGKAHVVNTFVTAILSDADLIQSLDNVVGSLLVIAIESQHTDVIRALIETGKGLNYTGPLSQTPTYLAARMGLASTVQQLLDTSADANIREPTHGWTAVTVAAVQGHLDVVQLLARSSKLSNVPDTRGWLAIDHAAYRGYLDIAKVLGKVSFTGYQELSSRIFEAVGGTKSQNQKQNRPTSDTLESAATTNGGEEASQQPSHHVVVNLGTLDVRKVVQDIDICALLKGSHPQQILESQLVLHVSATGCCEEYARPRPSYYDDSADRFEDVQVTKDFVPVIYHDFLVSETGLDSPMYTLSLAQYPMRSEADDWKMDPLAMELNMFLDSILSVLFEFCAKRRVMLSSFSPELCIVLAQKQRVFPILFLNDSSNWPTGDVRALSLQSAIHFARRWKLDGVVMASEPFTISPRLISFVRENDLFCASYGSQNDDPVLAKAQAAAGIDALVVNEVKRIVMSLDENCH
ncbi:Glycerophosphocholine phosphodiesterase, partial [Conoideocrella luteorostrata]